MRHIVCAFIALFLLSSCTLTADLTARNEQQLQMAVVLGGIINSVGTDPSANMALGYLIGSGAFEIQKADTFVDYMKGAGFFARAFLPYADLIWGSAGYEGLVMDSNGGDILFHSTKNNGELNQLFGNDNSQPRSEYVTKLKD